MNKKLVLAASICVLSGMANASSMPKGSFPIGSTPVEAKGSAQDPCQFNGFYGSIRAGYGITHVKDTITTKPATMSGTITGYMDNPALVTPGAVTAGTQATASIDLSAQAAYITYLKNKAAIDAQALDYTTRSAATTASATWTAASDALTTAAATKADMTTPVTGQFVLDAVQAELYKFKTMLEAAGGSVITDLANVDFSVLINAPVYTFISRTAIQGRLPGSTTTTTLIPADIAVLASSADNALDKEKAAAAFFATKWNIIKTAFDALPVKTAPVAPTPTVAQGTPATVGAPSVTG